MFGWREQLNKHLRAGERSGCLWRGTQAIPSHLMPNWALITQTPLLCFVVVWAQWVWRETLAVWSTALYLSLFLFIPPPTQYKVFALLLFISVLHQLHSVELQAILPQLMRLHMRPSDFGTGNFKKWRKKAFCTIHYARIAYGSFVSSWGDCRCGINVHSASERHNK